MMMLQETSADERLLGALGQSKALDPTHDDPLMTHWITLLQLPFKVQELVELVGPSDVFWPLSQ